MIRIAVAFMLGVTVVLGGVSAVRGVTARGPSGSVLNGLTVKGNHLVDHAGHTVQLRGVNRSGTEYACIQGWGISDGPNDVASVGAIASWHVNIVRVPLNEDCWLGINRLPGKSQRFGCSYKSTLPSRYYGSAYVRAIKAYVRRLHAAGMYAEVSLIWGAPGKCRATYQPGGPDKSHSPAMWRRMARAFRRDPNVILAPWGETTTGWKCFMHGCRHQATYGARNRGYRTAGMQQAVKIMRRAGYRGVIAIPCIDYANQCAGYDKSSWLRSHPKDPLHNLVAEAHVYGNNMCGAQNNGACLQQQYGNLAKKFPVIWGETGETYDDSECTSNNMQVLLPWADRHISGYMAWTWDTWGDCLALIKDYNSAAPSDAYARYIKAHYARK